MSNSLVVAGPGNNLSSYLAYIKKIDVLTPMEEQKLAIRWYEDQDTSAAQSLVMSHLRFVVYIARTYNGYGLPLSDLIQEGNIGLMKAVKRFNPHYGVRLMSFAAMWIRSEIHEYIIKNWRIVKVATTQRQRKIFFRLRSSRKTLNWLTEKEIKEMAKDLNVPEKDVRDMEAKLSYTDTPFDSPISNDDEEQDNVPANYIADNKMNPAVLAEQGDWDAKAKKALEQVMEKLSERDREIIMRRWLQGRKVPLEEVAKEVGMSREGVRNIEKRVFNLVRNQFSYPVAKAS